MIKVTITFPVYYIYIIYIFCFSVFFYFFFTVFDLVVIHNYFAFFERGRQGKRDRGGDNLFFVVI